MAWSWSTSLSPGGSACELSSRSFLSNSSDLYLFTTSILVRQATSTGSATCSILFSLKPILIEGSLEVKLPTICRDGKAEVGRVGEEKSRSEKIRDGESQQKEDAGARKGRKVAIRCVFPMIWGSGGSKSNLAKAAGAEPAGHNRDEELHAIVARSTFLSQKCQKPTVSDHFRKLRCRKSARRCGAKHISESKVSKTYSLRSLLEVEMSQKCTPLWREAHFQVKSVKNPWSQTTLEIEMSQKCTPLWREAHFQVKMYKARGDRTTFGS